ncbi:hypothetical protein T484DRAFT_1762611, partial [Baffinella frigidus]
MRSDVQDFVEQWQKGKLKPMPGCTMRQVFEMQVNGRLNNALSEGSNIVQMRKSGSKGTDINLGQIIALVGQQNIEGCRIPYGFKRRTLPHFIKDDPGAESRGFVENSYTQGLTPQEMFFHAMGGREGLIDTAVKTSETGYIQRRLIKALEDVIVRYDGTVRNSLGSVIQMDALRYDGTVRNSLGSIIQLLEAYETDMDAADFGEAYPDFLSEAYEMDMDAADFGKAFLSADMRKQMTSDLELRERLKEEYKRIQQDQYDLRVHIFSDAGIDAAHLPCSFERLVKAAQREFRLQPTTVIGDLHPNYILDRTKELLNNLQVALFPGDDPISIEARQNATHLFSIMFRSTLSTKRVLSHHRLDKKAFDHVLGEVMAKFKRAICNPGESVGCIASQSLGEPVTQMTLNTFHFAG